jgi:hypothetical protein
MLNLPNKLLSLACYQRANRTFQAVRRTWKLWTEDEQAMLWLEVEKIWGVQGPPVTIGGRQNNTVTIGQRGSDLCSKWNRVASQMPQRDETMIIWHLSMMRKVAATDARRTRDGNPVTWGMPGNQVRQ